MGKGCLWPVPGDRGGAVPPFPDSSRHGNAAEFPGACGGTPVTDGHRAREACAAARGGAATRRTCRVHAELGSGEPGTPTRRWPGRRWT